MSHWSSSSNSEEDNQSVISSSGSEEYLPKPNEFLDIESDFSTEEMNFIGQHPTNLQTPVIPVNMVQPVPMSMSQFPIPPPGMGMNVQGGHEASDNILEFMSKQSKIIGSNMMEELASPTIAPADNGDW